MSRVARTPDGPPPPPAVQRLRVRYAKRGPLRFSSHRDFQRAFERALRRSGVPMAYSAGFSPHPKISYSGASPTGVASEAEYLEIAVTERVDPAALRDALDASLPHGLDILEVVEAAGGSLPDRLTASRWRIVLPGVSGDAAAAAVRTFLAADEVLVVRRLKDGQRTLNARAPVVRAEVEDDRAGRRSESSADSSGVEAAGQRRGDPAVEADCAILGLVVRHVTPAVRPDDVLAGLRAVADLSTPAPAAATRLAQGPLDETEPSAGRIADPLAPDRSASAAEEEPVPATGTAIAGVAVSQRTPPTSSGTAVAEPETTEALARP